MKYIKIALFYFDSLLGGYFGQYLEFRCLEFFLAWGRATQHPLYGKLLKKLFDWFCLYFTGIIIPSRYSPMIMPYQDIITIVKRARIASVSPCSCKSYFMPDDSIPRDTCMGFYFVESLDHLATEGYHESFEIPQRVIDKLKECEDHGLIHQIMTVSRPTGKKGYVLCNCDSSSCIPLYLYKHYDIPIIRSFGYSLYITQPSLCTQCGKCITRCHFDAAFLEHNRPRIHSLRCMGCGVCVSTCPAGIRTLVKKSVR